jgi:hypothetical protein
MQGHPTPQQDVGSKLREFRLSGKGIDSPQKTVE